MPLDVDARRLWLWRVGWCSEPALVVTEARAHTSERCPPTPTAHAQPWNICVAEPFSNFICVDSNCSSDCGLAPDSFNIPPQPRQGTRFGPRHSRLLFFASHRPLHLFLLRQLFGHATAATPPSPPRGPLQRVLRTNLPKSLHPATPNSLGLVRLDSDPSTTAFVSIVIPAIQSPAQHRPDAATSQFERGFPLSSRHPRL